MSAPEIVSQQEVRAEGVAAKAAKIPLHKKSVPLWTERTGLKLASEIDTFLHVSSYPAFFHNNQPSRVPQELSAKLSLKAWEAAIVARNDKFHFQGQ